MTVGELRTRRLFAFVFGATALLLPQVTSALGTSTVDGNKLQGSCHAFIRMAANYDGGATISVSDSVDGAFCSGYLMGVVDDHFNVQVDDTRSPSIQLDTSAYPTG